MNTNLIEVANYDGPGYKPLVSYGTWRVAVLRYLDDLHPDRINSMERHAATDEVFILTKGRAMLILGGNEPNVCRVCSFRMNIGEIYNIKKNTWHTLVLSDDAHLVIIENDDTGSENSSTCSLSNGIQTSIRLMAQDFFST